jgi:hypothetical protein
MATKKTTRARKTTRAKATKKTSVRKSRKAPAVSHLGAPVAAAVDLRNPDAIGLP